MCQAEHNFRHPKHTILDMKSSFSVCDSVSSLELVSRFANRILNFMNCRIWFNISQISITFQFYNLSITYDSWITELICELGNIRTGGKRTIWIRISPDGRLYTQNHLKLPNRLELEAPKTEKLSAMSLHQKTFIYQNYNRSDFWVRYNDGEKIKLPLCLKVTVLMV